MKRHIFSRGELVGIAFRLADLFTIAFCGSIAFGWRTGEFIPSGNYQLVMLLLMFLTINVFSACSVYQAWRGQGVYRELARVTLAWTFVILCMGIIAFLSKTGEDYSRLWAGWTFAASYLILIGYRIVVRAILRRKRSLGLNNKQVVIVGAGELGRRACDAMQSARWAGLTPVAFFDDNESISEDHNGVKVRGTLDDVVHYIEDHRAGNAEGDGIIDQVWIALPLAAGARIEELQLALQDTATNIYFIPDLFGFKLANYSVDEIVGLPVMNMSATPMTGINSLIKRAEDILVSAAMLIVLSPLLVITAVLIKMESPGPIFFKQRRYGQDGKEILVWKFRSMTVTEDGDKVVQAQREDARITKIGAWIRKLSIDELPQLFNVLSGSMSLVGPRPHAVAHNEYYRTKVKGYMSRHRIRPGITGWAQVNGARGETAEVSDMADRIQYDLEYIRNWSIFLDLKILFMTIKTVMNAKDTY